MIRVAVVGLGVISRFYLAALREHPGTRLAAVADVDSRALEPLRGEVPTYTDHRDLLRRERPDAVVITVPNDAHRRVCHDALDAGAAVCVEKPLATSLQDGTALLHHARATGALLFTAFHRRYNAAVGALLRRLPADVPVKAVTVRYLERIEEHAGADGWYLDPARCGGGCLADNGPNAFDLVRLLLGDVGVAGAAIDRDTRGVDRWAVVDLHAGTGATATVELRWSYPGECKDIEVRLADGTAYRADMLAGHRGFKASLWHEYRSLVGDFVTTYRQGRRPVVPAAEDPGYAALALVEAAYRAAASGVRRVPPGDRGPGAGPPHPLGTAVEVGR